MTVAGVRLTRPDPPKPEEPSSVHTLYRGRHDSAAPASAWAAARLAAFPIGADVAGELGFCVNELLANLVDHAFTDDRGHEVTLSLDLRDAVVEIRVRDDGRPFDPAQPDRYAVPDSPDTADARGYGLHILRSFVDELRHERAQGWNVLTVRRKTQHGGSVRRGDRDARSFALRSYLDSMMRVNVLRAKKSLGQHFLVDPNVARKIVAALDPRPGERVVEIGPGTGALTIPLARSGADITAVEIDGRAVEALRAALGDAPNVRVVHDDARAFDFRAAAADGPVRVIGNLPYNVTSPVLFRLFAQSDAVRDAVFLVQKEVGDRLAAAPGTKDYGILAVIAQTHARVRAVFSVPPTVFRPRPSVWSALVAFAMRDDLVARIRDRAFHTTLVRTAFNQRRKTLANALKPLALDPAVLPDDWARLAALRAERLTVEDYIRLANACAP
jgi:16S rRNA (adenine1518-N6/adenine1519-N6)-dimethyltransferase